MPDKQEILPCPFCKGVCTLMRVAVIAGYDSTGRYVDCFACRYSSGIKSTEAKAIAAHNRVSRNNAAADDMRGALEFVQDAIERGEPYLEEVDERMTAALAKEEE